VLHTLCSSHTSYEGSFIQQENVLGAGVSESSSFTQILTIFFWEVELAEDEDSWLYRI